jgi:tRNA pseudouridine38-40 synthase
MRNIKLTVQYDGTGLAGFQRQPQQRTIQGELEKHLGKICGHAVRVIGAGRTDAGVHALGQTANFKTHGIIPTDRIPIACNSLLPRQVAVTDAERVAQDFHARYDACGKVYRYSILNRPSPSPFLARFAWHIPKPLDTGALCAATEPLLGRHDFTSFCAAQAEVQDRRRELRAAEWARRGDVLTLTLEADGFLHHMARIIVGTLVEVGLGRLNAEAVGEALAARDRAAAGRTAPPHGLCLVRVIYHSPETQARGVMAHGNGINAEDILGEAN